jgi:Holliday junction resolvase RusA-like endonuclease
MRITFEVLGVPCAKGRPRLSARGGFARAYTPAKTRHAEESFAARAVAHRPDQPFACPVKLIVHFIMPIPASWSKKQRTLALAGAMPHVTKPDLDNLVKLIKDALNGVFWLDDKQVFSVIAAKYYGEIPKTTVDLTTRDDDGVPF